MACPYGEQNSKTCLPGWYRSFDTCPTSCPYANGGCYGRGGPCSLAARRDDATLESLLLTVSKCIEIAEKKGYPAVRMNVTGDFRNDAELHALLEVKKASGWSGYLFGFSSADLDAALVAECRRSKVVVRRSGFAGKWGTVVVDEAATAKAHKIFVCPGKCATCQVCWLSSRTVAFVAHGSGRKKAIEASPFMRALSAGK